MSTQTEPTRWKAPERTVDELSILRYKLNGFYVPSGWGSWSIEKAYTKNQLFWRGQGHYRYKPSQWEETTLPGYYMEPDRRFCLSEQWVEWYKGWCEYLDEHGIVGAAQFLGMCDMYKVKTAFQYASRCDMQPTDLLRQVKSLTGVDPSSHQCLTSYLSGGPWSLDLITFITRVMEVKGDDYDEFMQSEGSIKDWLTEHYDEGTMKAVEQLLEWKPPEEELERHREVLRDYIKLRDEAMATTTKMKCATKMK